MEEKVKINWDVIRAKMAVNFFQAGAAFLGVVATAAATVLFIKVIMVLSS